MNGFWLFLIFLVVFAAVYWFFSSRRAKATPPDLYRKLLLSAMGDRAMAERLIELERRRHPEANRAQLIRYAIERWERDNQ
jgi:hypothetical protein